MDQSTGEDFRKMVYKLYKLVLDKDCLIIDLFYRLNAKLKPRNVAIQDLVTDLSDGVNTDMVAMDGLIYFS